jgi:hypothetical protein
MTTLQAILERTRVGPDGRCDLPADAYVFCN